MAISLRSVLFALFIVSSGCAVGPSHNVPEVVLPEQFKNDLVAPVKEDVLKEWWKNLNDPTLNHLIEQALKSNLDLKLAQARVNEARAALDQTVGGFLPEIFGTASFERSKRSADSRNQNNNSNFSSQVPENLYHAGFDAGWEINIFGVGQAYEAAESSLEAQEDLQRNVLITLLAEVAQNYLTLRGFQQRLQIANENIKIQQDLFEVQKLKLLAGSASELSVAQAEAQLSTTQSTLPSLESGVKQSIYRLSVLLGKYPSDLENELSNLADLPKGPNIVPAGLPSELLRRRPDIRQAERELAASTALVGVYMSDLFPTITLTGAFGTESMSLSSLSKNANKLWNVGAALDLPIFSPEKWAQVSIQDARQEQAVINYKLVTLAAFEEVENSLVAYGREQQRMVLLAKAVEANQRAVQMAQELYEAGISDFLNLVTAQQSLFQSQDQLSQSRRIVTLNLIALYKALGGGWETISLRLARNSGEQ